MSDERGKLARRCVAAGVVCWGIVCWEMAALATAAEGTFALTPPAKVELRLAGEIGGRAGRNVTQWLVRAPLANPGLLGMFPQRDRAPRQELVPWAGEFVGKYLISGVQALSMTDDPALRNTLDAVVAELLSHQADDGYLGPFRREERLLGNWDLWGHYHILLGLLQWHDATGDPRAIPACRKMADLMCRIYLDGSRRMLAAGSPEMNLSTVHGLALLYQRTGEPRYLRLAEEVVKDFEGAGDYLRQGLAEVPFYRTPRPRWESLHCLQGLVELYRITGDDRYRRSFLNLWSSIRRHDRRNSGAFSSGEQATGDPFADTAIETCCTIAWMAITLDALRLTGDATIADELELSTLNAAAGAQHPSGSWWTYDTPMNGRRKASAHDIVFQARAGTPELNCCSVNGPRGLGMLAEWGVMLAGDDVAVNYFGPGRTTVTRRDGTAVTLEQQGDFLATGEVTLRLVQPVDRSVTLRVRIPKWSRETIVVDGAERLPAESGKYLRVTKTWTADTPPLRLKFDMTPRIELGAKAQAGKVSIYRGPLLLAFDPQYSELDGAALPPLARAQVITGQVQPRKVDDVRQRAGVFPPWLLFDVATATGKTVRLCDFASAGSAGTAYRSWLAMSDLPPTPPAALWPRNGGRVSPGGMLFGWQASEGEKDRQRWQLVVQAADSGAAILRKPATSYFAILSEVQTKDFPVGRTLRWRLEPRAENWSAEDRRLIEPLLEPWHEFTIDAARPQRKIHEVLRSFAGENGVLINAALAGDVQPSLGEFYDARGWQPTTSPAGKERGAVALDGKTGMIRYDLWEFPRGDYTLAVWVRPRGELKKLGQIASAWHAGMDDPLRLCIQDGKLFARIEAGKLFSTEGVAVERDRWQHVAVVKSGGKLTLFVDGQPRGTVAVPEKLSTHSTTLALGGNPRHTDPESLAADLAQFTFHARALSAGDVQALTSQRP